jgi:hypothetical protein
MDAAQPPPPSASEDGTCLPCVSSPPSPGNAGLPLAQNTGSEQALFDAALCGSGTDGGSSQAAMADLAQKSLVRQLVTRNVFAASLARYFADDADHAAGALADLSLHADADADAAGAGARVGGGGGGDTTAISHTTATATATATDIAAGGAAAPAAPELPLPPVGSRVRCEGLKTAVELNGCVGYVMFHQPGAGNAAVRVNDGLSGRVVGLSPANMVIDNPKTLEDARRDIRAAGLPPKGVAGRGLHSFPFQLSLSSSVHRITQLN